MTEQSNERNDGIWGGEGASENLDIITLLKERSGGQFLGPVETIRKFEKIYRILPQLSHDLIEQYRVLARQLGKNPNRIDLIMVGGRVKGKPFKENSDIDVLFAVDEPAQSIEHIDYSNGDVIDLMDARLVTKRAFKAFIKKKCEEYEIEDLMHILDYGAQSHERYQDKEMLLLSSSTL